MNVPQDSGYLEIIIGPMFSGKTSRLIHLQKMYTLCDMSVCVVNYDKDTRYHDTMLSTHDKQMIECMRTDCLDHLLEKADRYDVFLINEIQFFTEMYHVVKELVDTHRKIVHVSGLDGTFERKEFNRELMKLIPIADDVVKLSSICKVCKKKACFSKRIGENRDNREKVLIGGEESYIPVCRKCYLQK